jgi:hypothetical protein
LTRAVYPRITSRASSRAHRDCTADTDSPAVAANWASGPARRRRAPATTPVYLVEALDIAHGRTVTEAARI